MSNQPFKFSNPLDIQIVQTIDQLDLPVVQKHHIRILAHCIAIFQATSTDDISNLDKENLLREWCNEQSKKFNDQKFNDLLYEQLVSAAKKLNNFSTKIGKNIKELDLNDLIVLVKEV